MIHVFSNPTEKTTKPQPKCKQEDNGRSQKSTQVDRHEIGKDWHYHALRDRENHLIWDGQYDLYPLWSKFGIPEDLSGKSVLDIGTATGFFAFECEKRGPKSVVGTELEDIANWDTRGVEPYSAKNIPLQNQADFKEAKGILNSKVELAFGNISDPLHEEHATFDLVIFGSMLTHICDPMRALKNILALTTDKAVIITTYAKDIEEPILLWARDGRPVDWWIPSKSVIPAMLQAAGFSKVEEISCFSLKHRNRPPMQQGCWHASP